MCVCVRDGTACSLSNSLEFLCFHIFLLTSDIFYFHWKNKTLNLGGIVVFQGSKVPKTHAGFTWGFPRQETHVSEHQGTLTCFSLVKRADVPSAHLFRRSVSGISAASCSRLDWSCLDSELDPRLHAGSLCSVWECGCCIVSELTGCVPQQRSNASEWGAIFHPQATLHKRLQQRSRGKGHCLVCHPQQKKQDLCAAWW